MAQVRVDVIDNDGGWFYSISEFGRLGPYEVDDATVARWQKAEADYKVMQDELQALTDG